MESEVNGSKYLLLARLEEGVLNVREDNVDGLSFVGVGSVSESVGVALQNSFYFLDVIRSTLEISKQRFLVLVDDELGLVHHVFFVSLLVCCSLDFLL